jgi:C-terminal processing protease CtpA/Prc
MKILLLTLLLACQAAYAQDSTRTVYDVDREFDTGSGIRITALSNVQIENLATLGKVWGFLKYHHPSVTSGQRQWDYELLRVTPAILASRDRAEANTALRKWIASLGEIIPCDPCASLPAEDLQLRPALDWLEDSKLLGSELQADLKRIHRNRPASGQQFFVDLAKGVKNPVFKHEPVYDGMRYPDAGFRLLALFRFWNIIEYWAPYRDVIGEDWNGVLHQSIPKVVLAKDRRSYELEMMAVIARVNDTHSNLWSSLHVRPPLGLCKLPLNVRFIGSDAVVAGYTDHAAGKATGLLPGDIIVAIDNTPVAQLVQTWRPYYAASNEPTRLRDIAQELHRGPCGGVSLRIRRESGELDLQASRTPEIRSAKTHDRPGDTFQMLPGGIAYLKLSSIKQADIPGYMEAAAGTKGLVIDIRNYPSEFVVFTLGQYLVDRPTNFVRFTVPDLNNPGAYYWNQGAALRPGKTHYAGKVIILIDEISQSMSEYTSLAFRSAPRARIIGSTTAGADGNVSRFGMPGGLGSLISGIGIFHPDKRPTQRIGIIPDIEVIPTIEGIRAGRDEVLETAITEIQRQD